MGKEGKEGKPAAQKKQDSDALAADVGRFAAGLGFAAGGNDFDDFAPHRAKQKLRPSVPAPAAVKAPKASKDGKDGPSKRDQGDKSADAGTAKSTRPVDPRVLERTWNVGAGPRPGKSANRRCLHDAPPLIDHHACCQCQLLPR